MIGYVNIKVVHDTKRMTSLKEVDRYCRTGIAVLNRLSFQHH